MNRRVRKFFDRYKKPFLFVLGYFVLILLFAKIMGTGIYLKDFLSQHRLKENRALSDTGIYDLSVYDLKEDHIASRGAAYADQILLQLLTEPTATVEKLNLELLQSRGYDLNTDIYLNSMNEFSDKIEANRYELSYWTHHEPLSSGGIVFDFYLIKQDVDEFKEFRYEPFEQELLSVTIYFKEDEPVLFLPFPEPSLHAYANQYGFFR